MKKGFTLVEVLVVIGIIGLLSVITFAAVLLALKKARDVKRKATLVQAGRFLVGANCYMPDAGAGDYDLGQIYPEIRSKYPQYSVFLASAPKDPSGGTDTLTKYRYQVSVDGQSCILYANLEYDAENVTITGVSAPTLGAGTGVLEAATEGPNGAKKYFQVSK